MPLLALHRPALLLVLCSDGYDDDILISVVSRSELPGSSSLSFLSLGELAGCLFFLHQGESGLMLAYLLPCLLCVRLAS